MSEKYDQQFKDKENLIMTENSGFNPKSGVIIDSSNLSDYLKQFSNIKFHHIDLINTITNTEGGISGGSSDVLQMFGSRDDDELIILTFLPDGKVWALSDMEVEGMYREEEYPAYLIHHTPDVRMNNIDSWSNYACSDDTDTFMASFLQAIVSISGEGLGSDSVNLFEDKYSECNAIWSDSLTGFYDVPEEAEEAEYWTYAGFWMISQCDADLSIENNQFLYDGEAIELQDAYDELSEKIWEVGYEEYNVSVGAGLLVKK